MKTRTLILALVMALGFPVVARSFPSATGFPETKGAPLSVDLLADIGVLGGYTRYRIGGHVDASDGHGDLRFPISELKFPLSVVTVSAGVAVGFLDDFSLRFAAATNLDRDAGKMEDSDWGAWYLTYGPPFRDDSLDIYSESDADLEAVMLRADLLWRFVRAPRVSVGAGVGYRYQNFSYDVKNLNQWYPSSRGYFGHDLAHDYQNGLVLTYEVTYHIPYLEAVCEVKPVGGLSLAASLGLAPWVGARDRDDHILRSKLSKGEDDGWGVMADAAARWDFLPWLYAEAGMGLTYLWTEGTETQVFYATTSEATAGTSAEIDQEIESFQYTFNAGLGVRF